MVLEELGVPYEIVSIKFEDVKKKPFTDINPNGRCPGTCSPGARGFVWPRRLAEAMLNVALQLSRTLIRA